MTAQDALLVLAVIGAISFGRRRFRRADERMQNIEEVLGTVLTPREQTPMGFHAPKAPE